MSTTSEKGLKTQGLKQSQDAAELRGSEPPGTHSDVHWESSEMNSDTFS